MMKSYLRYEPDKTIGIISSPNCNIACSHDGNLIFTGGIEDALLWNLRTGNQVLTLSPESPNYPYNLPGETRYIKVSPDGSSVAVGYSTGDIRIFDYIKNTIISTLHGHRSDITALHFATNQQPISPQSDLSVEMDISSTSLALYLLSGSADTDIYVWDCVTWSCTYILTGHKSPITSLTYMFHASQMLIISTSKDTLVKVWDTSTQACVQTLIGYRSEIWSMAKYGNNIIIGGQDDTLVGYRLASGDSALLDENENAFIPTGNIQRSIGSGGTGGTKSRCNHLVVNAAQTLLAAVSDHKSIEFYRIRSAADAVKKGKRRIKRQREKLASTSTPSTPSTPTEIPPHDEDDEDQDPSKTILQDDLEHIFSYKHDCKIKSFTFLPSNRPSSSTQKPSRAVEKFIISSIDNKLDTMSITMGDVVEVGRVSGLELHGHRSDVRGVSVSDDGLLITTGRYPIPHT